MHRYAPMKILLKILCLAYFILLTRLLFSERPEEVLGMRAGLPWLLRELLPVAHLLSFFVLALLAVPALRPLPLWASGSLLIAYGGATELLQRFVPGRTPDWLDGLQDLGGVAAGVVLCWAVAGLRLRWVRECGAGGDAKPIGPR